ncbi:MAG: dipicolinate synthase subunit B [Oscillospiraceae bacterium]|nr:dipicolinate synthase subunit B [Oscillospiraceae bacterium]
MINNSTFKGLRAGFALCGSFCTFDKSFSQITELISKGVEVTPVMSHNAASIDTRFGKAAEHKEKLQALCGREVIDTIDKAEPIGPKRLFDILIIAPCTGNTLAKLANGITDTAVTMAAKSHVRNSNPVLLALSTNDGLAGSSKNIGSLLNTKGYFFVPFGQDDFEGKPRSLIADFNKIPEAAISALNGVQLQPLLF